MLNSSQRRVSIFNIKTKDFCMRGYDVQPGINFYRKTTRSIPLKKSRIFLFIFNE